MSTQQYQSNTLFQTCPGLGDALMSRWVLRDCDETCRVFTAYPFVFQGLKIKPVPLDLLPDEPVSEKQRAVPGGELYSSYPTKMSTRSVTNAASSISRCGSLMGAMLSNSGQRPQHCYRDLPPVQHWELPGNPDKKPVAVINPNTIRDEVQKERMPLSEYLTKAALMLKERGYYVVAPAMTGINDLELDGDISWADLNVSQGELAIEQFISLIKQASVVVTGMTGTLHISLAAGTPTLWLGGGSSHNETPETNFGEFFSLPNNCCFLRPVNMQAGYSHELISLTSDKNKKILNFERKTNDFFDILENKKTNHPEFHVVSFYTQTWLYPERAASLAQRCEELGLSYDIQERKTTGSWRNNTGMKPAYIREMLDKYEHILWVDCDGELFQRPELCINQPDTVDILACPHRTNSARDWHVGILSIRSNKRTKAFVDEWVNIVDKNKKNDVTDEFAFIQLMKKYPYVIFQALPDNYHVVMTADKDVSDAVFGLGVSRCGDKQRTYKTRDRLDYI